MVDPLQIEITRDDLQRLAMLRDEEMLTIPTMFGDLVLDRAEASTVLDAIDEVLRFRMNTLQNGRSA